MRTSYNGNVEATFTSLPYGDAQTQTSGSYDLDQHHFVQTDYDAETNTDHAEFRQYSPAQGRWMRPDPYAGSYDISNPQSLNRYEYALDNPVSNVDPSGLDWIECDENGNCWSVGSPSDPLTITIVFSNDPEGPLAPQPTLGAQSWFALEVLQFQNSVVGVPVSVQPSPSSGQLGLFSCASEFANKYSIAGGLHALGIGNNGGVGGFLTNAFGGNTFSGLTDAVQNGLSVADVAFGGTTQGLGGETAEQKGIVGVVTDAAVGRAWSAVTGAGQTIQTLNGAASLASTGVEAGEFATGVGEARLAYDALSYAAGLVSCAGR